MEASVGLLQEALALREKMYIKTNCPMPCPNMHIWRRIKKEKDKAKEMIDMPKSLTWSIQSVLAKCLHSWEKQG